MGLWSFILPREAQRRQNERDMALAYAELDHIDPAPGDDAERLQSVVDVVSELRRKESDAVLAAIPLGNRVGSPDVPVSIHRHRFEHMVARLSHGLDVNKAPAVSRRLVFDSRLHYLSDEWCDSGAKLNGFTLIAMDAEEGDPEWGLMLGFQDKAFHWEPVYEDEELRGWRVSRPITVMRPACLVAAWMRM